MLCWDGVALQRTIISAPFGNYVRPAGATPTVGTFTLERRRGRVWRVLRTVRRYRRLGAWVNRIGLRNPGIGWLEGRVGRGREDLSGKVLSVHGFDEEEWVELARRARALSPLAIELNMSCPNVEPADRRGYPFDRIASGGGGSAGLIVKLPPVRYEAMARAALEAGIVAFHCCNTLPVPGGGMSGKPLMPLSLRCLEVVRGLGEASGVGAGLVLIGGGGITGAEDVDRYAEAGATHVALGTRVMHPRYLWSDSGVRRVIEHAGRVLEGRAGFPSSV